MPKKKSGSKKKADKQKSRRILKLAHDECDLGKHPCNVLMVCEHCHKKQKNRSFCYFCCSINQLAICGNCGKSKCFSKTGDCVIKHPNSYPTGLGMVGAICDHCESFICHAKKCLSTHGCLCPLQDAVCQECKRDVWSHGGRMFRCSFCDCFICEDDQFEHQASCQKIDGEDFKCMTCNRMGQFVCLNCKISFCDEHVRRKGHKISIYDLPSCPKCTLITKEVYKLSLSTKKYQYGRQIDFDVEKCIEQTDSIYPESSVNMEMQFSSSSGDEASSNRICSSTS